MWENKYFKGIRPGLIGLKQEPKEKFSLKCKIRDPDPW
jgi:hypothetical protein